MIFIFGDARNPALELIQSDSARARQMSALVFICAAHIDHQRIAAIDQLRGLGNAQRPRPAREHWPDKQSVGCGWMVLPISVASAPISIARQISPIKSPAQMPAIPPPIRRCVFESKSSLVNPSSRALEAARPDAAHGKTAFS